MSDPTDPSFDAPDLAKQAEALPVARLHALPFGAIRLDAEDRVVFYSESESRLSGYGAREAISRSFFTEIAPCMRDERFLGRIERARAAGTIDIEFEHVGDFEDRERALQVRILSAAGGGIWIFMRRP